MRKKLVPEILLVVVLLAATLACGSAAIEVPTPTQEIILPTETPTNDLPPTPMQTQTWPQIAMTQNASTYLRGYQSVVSDNILFEGKVINSITQERLNNRLVLLFLGSKELARFVTYTGKDNNIVINSGNLSGNTGVTDGYFSISVPNTYELSLDGIGVPTNKQLFVLGTTSDFFAANILSTWIDNFGEGEIRDFFIPSKNVHYTLMVLPGPTSALPAEIQQPGSLTLLDGNRLVAIDPNAPAPTPQPAFSNNLADFQQGTEDTQEFPPAIFPINNCGGAADVKQEISQTYIHEIIDESMQKIGIEIPILDWLTISAEIERHYGISDKEVTTYSTTLTVPAGQNIQYTVVRRQTWETGVAVVTSNGVEISAPYRILKSETFEVSNSEQKSCP